MYRQLLRTSEKTLVLHFASTYYFGFEYLQLAWHRRSRVVLVGSNFGGLHSIPPRGNRPNEARERDGRAHIHTFKIVSFESFAAN